MSACVMPLGRFPTPVSHQLHRSWSLKFLLHHGNLITNCRLDRVLSRTPKVHHRCVSLYGRVSESERRQAPRAAEVVEGVWESPRKEEPREAEIVGDYYVPRRTVAVFWDLDNKPPNEVPPYYAALRLKTLASEFGEVVDVVAYANQNAFTYVPPWVREEREDRKMLDRLERMGVVKVEQPYVCSMCGRKCKTNLDLKKHFKQMHERERNKRMAHAGHLKGKRRLKYLSKFASKEQKYKEAAKTVLVPKVGYGLAAELKRAGVAVRTVEKRPQAADEALVQHMQLYIHRGIQCICLVSDDSDFLGILKVAKKKHICVVVVGDTPVLRAAADSSFSWEDVASGRAMTTANNSYQRWSEEEALLRAELMSDDELDHVGNDGSPISKWDNDDEVEFLDSQRNLRCAVKQSAFADDEEDYYDTDEEGEEDEEEGNVQESF